MQYLVIILAVLLVLAIGGGMYIAYKFAMYRDNNDWELTAAEEHINGLMRQQAQLNKEHEAIVHMLFAEIDKEHAELQPQLPVSFFQENKLDLDYNESLLTDETKRILDTYLPLPRTEIDMETIATAVGLKPFVLPVSELAEEVLADLKKDRPHCIISREETTHNVVNIDDYL